MQIWVTPYTLCAMYTCVTNWKVNISVLVLDKDRHCCQSGKRTEIDGDDLKMHCYGCNAFQETPVTDGECEEDKMQDKDWWIQSWCQTLTNHPLLLVWKLGLNLCPDTTLLYNLCPDTTLSLHHFASSSCLSHLNQTPARPNIIINICVSTRAGKSKSLIWFTIRLLANKYLISGDVLNPESEGSAPSHKNLSRKVLIIKCS